MEWGVNKTTREPAMDVNRAIELPNYNSRVHYHTKSLANPGYAANYSYVEFEIHLARRLEGAIISAIAPSFLFVIIAYLSLYIPHETLVVRVTINMFILLDM